MVSITIEYQGDLHCVANHGPSGAIVSTDAPKDNQGKGESFSPTDLLATALGTCMVTIMGITARSREIDISGTTVHVIKEMIQQPVRRIGKLTVTITLPNNKYTEKELEILHDVAQRCPVMQSIHPDIIVNYTLEIAS